VKGRRKPAFFCRPALPTAIAVNLSRGSTPDSQFEFQMILMEKIAARVQRILLTRRVYNP
jgi:hypothetical protein